jgi:hypothetical protein
MASICILIVLLLSFFRITYAFEHMDICNYTDWDTSWNYYDWLCTINGKLAEERDKSFVTTYISWETVQKTKKNHALNEVKHRTGSSSTFIFSNNTQNSKEIEKLKYQLQKQNTLLIKYKEENDTLILEKNNLSKKIIWKDILLKNFIKQNNILKYYLKNSGEFIEDTKIYSQKTNKKSASQIVKERIMKRNSLIK